MACSVPPEQVGQLEQRVRETAFIFLTIFLLINALPDDGLKESGKCAVTVFCSVRVITEVLILLEVA